MSRSKKELIEQTIDEIVPIPAQYNEDLSLNVEKMAIHTEWLISQGVKVIYLGMAASELEYMTKEERLQAVEAVSKANKGRAVLLSQPLFTGTVEEHGQEAKAMVDLGADILIIKLAGLKGDQTIFSSKFRKNGYVARLHDPYFLDALQRVHKISKGFLITHDKPFLSFDYLAKVMAHDFMVGIKTHEDGDPFIRQKIYRTYGKDYICFDGMGKVNQFWSLIWGARARHTNWSWFDPQTDQKFTKAVKEGRYNEAVAIVENEWPVVDAILSAGHHGYKALMGLKGLPYSAVRNPGWIATQEELNKVKEAAIKIGLVGEESRAVELAVLGN